ncbi:NAD(P)/FAD-dependent oxidoreductase [Natronococcus sp. A-GB7]|uniref:FAD-dependent oxidoreductase n=1 Tax=Natronococcus sp. A-GB7 TaxID=3037649 RepID=UPI00241DAEDC|nr:NAD(P)/FAD-dependent oxidoreductase [Natronococcus sp. A-GB7]MDG5821503.1 NAD(P)/FAD-dependent oxidoreductase [Natronococcus sp. A-GB7]
MTLATVRPGDEDRSGRAIVVGAGVAGLTAARVLADSFDSVTVIDRDPLPDEPVPRPGVPQATQIHILWEAGRSALEELFPGYTEELCAAGGVSIDGRRDLHLYSQGEFLASGSSPFPLYAASRPLYEQLLRRRVAELEGVRLRPRCRFVAYETDERKTGVTGVSVRPQDGDRTELPAELVVDATGRTSRTPAWLARNGYGPPPVEEVTIGLAYTTIALERPPDDRRMIGMLAEPPRTRGGAVLPVEGNRWLVNVHGVHGDHPPTDVDGVGEFVAPLPTPVFDRLLEECPPLAETGHHYPFPSNRRYRYEALERFPDGLIVVGDAVASFNPIYGQGMSVAALEALALRRTLRDGRSGIPTRFFDRMAAIVDPAWMLAIGADSAFSETRGDVPRGTAVFDWYLSRLFRKAHADGALTDAFLGVLSMQQPPSSLLRPSVAWRVLGPGYGGNRSARDRPNHPPSVRESERDLSPRQSRSKPR